MKRPGFLVKENKSNQKVTLSFSDENKIAKLVGDM